MCNAHRTLVRIKPQQSGFSLAELAIVLLILGVLMQASVNPLGQRLQYQRQLNAQHELEKIVDSIKAHWVTYGHIPCPIQNELNGNQSHKECRAPEGGVPAAALGLLGNVDHHGALLDPWNQPYRYRVSLHDTDKGKQLRTPDWITPGEITRVPFTTLQADLTVCRFVARLTCTEAGAASRTSAGDMVAVVMTNGPQHLPSETENRDADDAFVSAVLSDVETHAFDDQLIWISRSELIYLALQSGWL